MLSDIEYYVIFTLPEVTRQSLLITSSIEHTRLICDLFFLYLFVCCHVLSYWKIYGHSLSVPGDFDALSTAVGHNETEAE